MYIPSFLAAVGHRNSATPVFRTTAPGIRCQGQVHLLPRMVGRGEVRVPGVIAPEAPGGPDPDRFLAALQEPCWMFAGSWSCCWPRAAGGLRTGWGGEEPQPLERWSRQRCWSR